MDQQPSTPPDPIQREQALFAAALERASEDRATFLDGACHDDPELRQRLETLLAANDDPDSLLPEDLTADATHESPFHDEAVGQTLGRYKLLERVGEGGYGVVYVAEQTEPVRRRVALKVIKLGMDTKQVVARFEAERQALALMDHPNIAKVLDAGTTEQGRLYFVMELVRGIKITDYCDQEKMPTKERLDLFIKVCHAIQHAHQKGIIHRDIKPSNILVTLHDGVPVPKVIDFGIAKATEGRLTDATVYTQLHQFIGTPAYMSPEQAEMSGLDIDTRSDIYSLGVLLYEMLIGKTPFDGKELVSMGIDAMHKTIRESEPARPSTRLATLQGEELTSTATSRASEISTLAHLLKGDLDWIVMKCLEKDRQRRYDTANALAADIKRHLSNEPIIARPPSGIYRFQKAWKRNNVIYSATALVILSVIGGLSLATLGFWRENQTKSLLLNKSLQASQVAKLLEALVTKTIPDMHLRGNTQGAIALIDRADGLISSALTHSPSTELMLRIPLMNAQAERLRNFKGAAHQGAHIKALLDQVSDEEIPIPHWWGDSRALPPRPWWRIVVAYNQANSQTATAPNTPPDLKPLIDLEQEFTNSKPPAPLLAAVAKVFRGWTLLLSGSQKSEEIEQIIKEAYDQIPEPLKREWFALAAMTLRCEALLDQQKYSEMESLITEELKHSFSKRSNAGERDSHMKLAGLLIMALCPQEKFGDALQILQMQIAAVKGSSIDQEEKDQRLIRLQHLEGEVYARSGQSDRALEILEDVAENQDSHPAYWLRAALVAAGIGDHDRLSSLAIIRFASSTDGRGSLWIAKGLLQLSPDRLKLAIAKKLVDQAGGSLDWVSRMTFHFVKAELELRLGNYPEAAKEATRYLEESSTGYGSRYASSEAFSASANFIRAIAEAHQDHHRQALEDFNKAHTHLNATLGPDRGYHWYESYHAQALLREATELFEEKGMKPVIISP